MATNVMPREMHDAIIAEVYQQRGYTLEESVTAARCCASAARHGIKSHNGIKALHLEELFGSNAGGAVPGATIDKLSSRFPTVEQWNANLKLGQPVAVEAMETAMQLADHYGVGTVVVDNAFHYLWGGGYVIEAARKGYIAYTNCTASLAEVVPYKGKYPTIATNPHTYAFPTQDIIGFPICVDWATSKISMGGVQQLALENKPLPPESAIDKDGKFTSDPNSVFGLVPFGQHKGYGLSLVNELLAAFIGGSLPTIRGRFDNDIPGEKYSICMYFQVIHPDAIGCSGFARNRTQQENLEAVIEDILGHGNETCLLPGQLEAEAAKESDEQGGLLFTDIELEAFAKHAEESDLGFDRSAIRKL